MGMFVCSLTCKCVQCAGSGDKLRAVYVSVCVSWGYWSGQGGRVEVRVVSIVSVTFGLL